MLTTGGRRENHARYFATFEPNAAVFRCADCAVRGQPHDLRGTPSQDPLEFDPHPKIVRICMIIDRSVSAG
jgi:hypothetical protein